MDFVLIGLFLFFVLFFFIGLVKKDFGTIDIAWGLSFALTTILCSWKVNFNLTVREQLILALIVIWALRLSGYIWYRSFFIPGEDYRYTNMRKRWGDKVALNAFFKVYLGQGLLSLVISSPIIILFLGQKSSKSLGLMDAVGFALWLIGFLFESVGDYQKHRFKQKSKEGVVLDTGLWRYTRHPNYFGEVVLWWGMVLIILSEVPLYYAIWGPLILTYLLLKVSGVALLEKKYVGNTAYDAYKERTNAFIPWFPKEKK